MQIPLGSEVDFHGVIDLLTKQAFYWDDDLGRDIRTEEVPAEMLDQMESKRNQLVEKIAEHDDNLLLKYLENEPISVEELKAGLRKAVIPAPAGIQGA